MRLGIIGSGQLAQMMAHAGKPLGISFAFAAESKDGAIPVEGLGDIVMINGDETAEQLFNAMGQPDVVTVEKEDVNIPLLKDMQQFCRVAPNPDAVLVTQNREREKTYLRDLGIPTVGFAMAESIADIEKAVEELGFPVIVKSVEQGYDGKNQWRLKTQDDIAEFANHYDGARVIVEQWVKFTGEVSMIAARSVSGNKAFYPLTENCHKNGILLTSKTPASDWAIELDSVAQDYLLKLMDKMDYVGVLAMECFVVDGKLLVNELAPRVHNSGHWTQEGCEASQFENHLRAIFDMPLGNTKRKTPTAMLNLLGVKVTSDDVDIDSAVVHWYNKSVRPGRKVGHINITKTDSVDPFEVLERLEKQFYQ
ncbi:MAG: 5-(carboxyamino)imidazole ribonucleotide synthase [Gammaproteobacteria bacterium]|nr:5-(carboxyamino)imidazole ribonucleotide synthase [Gammaproteobacteria bacterium]